MVIESNSKEETYNAGVQLGQNAAPGQVYCIYGDLGVGKTIISQGVAAGLGITEVVNSPTFTIVKSMTRADCLCIILTCTGSAMWTRWMR